MIEVEVEILTEIAKVSWWSIFVLFSEIDIKKKLLDS